MTHAQAARTITRNGGHTVIKLASGKGMELVLCLSTAMKNQPSRFLTHELIALLTEFEHNGANQPTSTWLLFGSITWADPVPSNPNIVSEDHG